MGPGGISPGSYDPQSLTQDQRNWLYNYFGHSGEAPVGYGGEGMLGPRGDIATGIAGQAPPLEEAELPPEIQPIQGPSAEEIAQSLIDATFQPYQEALDRARQFDEENPFIFDEQLARASAEERFDPFYNAELSDFVGGVERTRQRSLRDERRVLGELTAQTEDYLGRTKRQLDQAIRASEQGYAGAGLFFGGERQRRTGEMEVEAGAQKREFLRDVGLRREETQLQRSDLLQDLAADEARFRRLHEAERDTSIQTDVERQRTEEQARREAERQQFIGFPLSGGSQTFTNIASLL